MLKVFPIDFIRQSLEQTLLEEHLKNVNLFGGKNQVNILSFYEQLKSQDEVDRFVETYRDLTEQQNRTGLILNGVLVSPENPSITNLYSCLIVPMTFTCSLRCTLENRDQAIETINNLINKLKGHKVDIAQLNCIDENGKPYSTPFKVGTLGNNDGAPYPQKGDFIGQIGVEDPEYDIAQLLNNLVTLFGFNLQGQTYWFYVEQANKLKVVLVGPNQQPSVIEDDGTHNDIIFPPEHESFEKYKVSFSFDAVRCDEPRNLNGKEYCELSFGGSATLVNNGVRLGNDLLKVKVSKNKIVASTDIVYTTNAEYLEPLEMPSGNNVNTQVNQLLSNNFLSNSHADSISISLQYTFMADFSSSIIKNWFNYARYGIHSTNQNGVSPNTIYEISEIWCSWADFDTKTFKAKIIENIDVENTESDTITISTTFQIQGDNN